MALDNEEVTADVRRLAQFLFEELSVGADTWVVDPEPFGYVADGLVHGVDHDGEALSADAARDIRELHEVLQRVCTRLKTEA